MFRSIFSFEVNRWYRSTSFYIYFAILFIVTFLFGTLIGGTFEGISVGTGSGSDKVFVNSPVAIDGILSGINSYLGMVMIVAVIGNSVLKDFSNNTYQLIFTTPVSRFNYLFGRFAASLLVVLLILTGPSFGLALSYGMPWIDADKFGPLMIAPYINNYLYTTIPNVIVMGSIFFAVSLVSRDIFFIWLFLIILFVILGVSESYFDSLDNQQIAALADPLGDSAKEVLTQHWNIYEKNNSQVMLTGIFLVNRLVWLGIAFVIMGIGYAFFSFSSTPRSLLRRKKKLQDKKEEKTEFKPIETITPSFSFSTGNHLKNLWALAVNECKSIIRNTYFRIILVFGIVFLILVSTQIGKIYDTTIFPVTSNIIQAFGGIFNLFIIVLTIIFSGDIIWKARDVRMSNILDAMPVPNWVYYVSKLIGIFFMQAVLLSIIVIAGIIVQTFKGYTNYEIGLYLKYLYGFMMIDYWIFAVIALFIQIVSKNRYTGFFITTIFFIWNTFFALLVLKHNLFVFFSDPGVQYSEMNGFGHTVFPFIVYKIYWGAFAVFMAILSSQFWARGAQSSFKARWKEFMSKTAGAARLAMLASLVIFLAAGGFIYYNTAVLNEFQTSFQAEKGQAEYEKKYSKYANIPQPKISAVKLEVNIFPDERDLTSSGTYMLRNDWGEPIDSIHINYAEDCRLDISSFGREFTLALNDSENGYRIYKLNEPLQPGDSLVMTFRSALTTKGFKYGFTGLSTPLYNGTFVNNQQFLPSIGYTRDAELSTNTTRKKHGLAHRLTSNPISDSSAYRRNLFTRDADFITFEATVSTKQGQTAIAPGYLQKQWTEKGRAYFHYKMDSPILNFFSFLSADYLVKKDKWNDVNIEIYYQKGHEYNLDRMIKGIKKSLDYYTANFSPYQHKQVRILEFPRYSTFAQSFPNTIPFSEGIGFIADVNGDKENVDYPFYVTAHEVAHQWFAHQIVGADVEGSNLLSESLAQYGAITVMSKEYDATKLRKFLRYEADKYLTSRSYEREKEKPLAYADAEQGYILYQKGGMVFNALNKFIGEDSLNSAIRRFIQEHGFKGAPYPTTLDLVHEIRQSTPDSLQYMVTDMFEKIAFYENKIEKADLKKAADKYVVEFTVDSKKFHVDTAGKSNPVSYNDIIEIGVFNKDNLLTTQQYRITKGINKFTITSAQQPDKIVIDPNYLLMDKDFEDNEKKIDKKSS